MLSFAMWIFPAQPCYITFKGEMVRLKVINEEKPDILENFQLHGENLKMIIYCGEKHQKTRLTKRKLGFLNMERMSTIY